MLGQALRENSELQRMLDEALKEKSELQRQLDEAPGNKADELHAQLPGAKGAIEEEVTRGEDLEGQVETVIRRGFSLPTICPYIFRMLSTLRGYCAVHTGTT